MEIPSIFKENCINCNNEISSDRLSYGLPCNKDLTEKEIKYVIDENSYFKKLEKLYYLLSKKNRLYKIKDIYLLEKNTIEFSNLFKKLINYEPWSIQKTWFKRLYNNTSFSMVAPTGVGKTTFISIASIFFAKKYKKRIYIILPTTLLVKQVYERLMFFLEKLGNNNNIKVLAYLGTKSKNIKEDIKNGNFDILITSNQFISKNFDVLKNNKFDIIFIDDVDAFFRSSKNIDKILLLLGFTEEDIELASRIIYYYQTKQFEKAQKEVNKLEKILSNRKHGVLILSSATGRVRGQKIKLYRELLKFTIGAATPKIRNIIDVYIEPKDEFEEEVYKLVKKLKDGILIFVSKEYGIEYAKKLKEYLDKKYNNIIKVEVITSDISPKKRDKILEDFQKGNINVLIGVAHFYGILVRGLDIPTRIKYVIFVGIPKFRINLTKTEKNLQSLLILTNLIKDVVEEEIKKEIIDIYKPIQNQLKKLSSGAFLLLSQAFQNGEKLEGKLETVKQNLEYLYNKIQDILKNKNILLRLEKHPEASIYRKGEDIYLQIPDIKTYIQASGRASRLYAGGITKGLSIIIVDDLKLLKILDKKLKILFE